MDFIVTLYPIVGLPLLNEGDDLAGILLSGIERSVGIACYRR
jgi:hypothetical protein